MIIRQIYSGKEFTVIHEDENGFLLRPIPDDHGPDIPLPRSLYELRWEPADGGGGARRRSEQVAAALAKPEGKRKRR